MSEQTVAEVRAQFEEEQERRASAGYSSPSGASPTDALEAARFWQQRYEDARLRLAKLWIFYGDLQQENANLKAEAELLRSRPERPVVLVESTQRRSPTKPPAPPEAAVDTGYRPQCGGITADGVQCSNPARHGSKYCIAHRNYHPRTARGIQRVSRVARRQGLRATDTEPRFQNTPDTSPTVRRG